MQTVKILKLTLIMAVVLGVTIGCAAQPNGHESKAGQSKQYKIAERAIAVAEEAQKRAQSVGGQWRDTSKIIKQAKKALKSGDVNKAIKAANSATLQGQMGYEQAMASHSGQHDHYGRYWMY